MAMMDVSPEALRQLVTHSLYILLCQLLSAWPMILKQPDGRSDLAQAGFQHPALSRLVSLPSPCSLSEVSSWCSVTVVPLCLEARGQQAGGDRVRGGSPRSMGIRPLLHVRCAGKGQGKQQVAAV